MKLNSPAELSSFLKAQRKQLKRSQADVCEKIGLHQPSLSSFEKQSDQSKIETLFRIAHELGLEVHLQTQHETVPDARQWTEEW
ncbi:helix-turn-helix domain-containing protein [Parashewanella spongiae]|uniref:Helix-turn-helix domain-containing protein n=1 Tax=Parashewanella spongiae TaxID=342950 RepID=A0A3A6U9U2_9GAMM|nr:helix-turn-helix domain-containing protein [Parashewanella spongiae]MCL1077056.1 helix-turn-helix domain-containing protein [Parashewanella spongiae]RJY18730.1 helix-turn-helix domain-containing protein [Parashewanella spongiae]